MAVVSCRVCPFRPPTDSPNEFWPCVIHSWNVARTKKFEKKNSFDSGPIKRKTNLIYFLLPKRVTSFCSHFSSDTTHSVSLNIFVTKENKKKDERKQKRDTKIWYPAHELESSEKLYPATPEEFSSALSRCCHVALKNNNFQKIHTHTHTTFSLHFFFFFLIKSCVFVYMFILHILYTE